MLCALSSGPPRGGAAGGARGYSSLIPHQTPDRLCLLSAGSSVPPQTLFCVVGCQSSAARVEEGVSCLNRKQRQQDRTEPESPNELAAAARGEVIDSGDSETVSKNHLDIHVTLRHRESNHSNHNEASRNSTTVICRTILQCFLRKSLPTSPSARGDTLWSNQ